MNSTQQVEVNTHGEGNNDPFIVAANEVAGPIIFSSADRWIRRKMATEGARTDD